MNFWSKYLLCVGCYLTISLTVVATVNIDSLHKVIASTTDIGALESAHKAASLFYSANNQEKLALKHARVLLNYYRNKQIDSINYDIVFNLAYYYYRQQCSDSGIYVIEIAEKIQRENNASQIKLWRTAIVKATFYVFDNKFKAAISLLDSLETEIPDNSSADSLRAGLDWLRGSIYSKQSIIEKSLTYYLRALKYHEAKGSPRATALMNNCALIYSDLNEYSKAEELLIKAHEINEKRENKIWLVNGLLNLGNLYRTTKQYKKSYENYYLAKLIADSLDNMKVTARVHAGMGTLFLALSIDTSRQFFNENEVLVNQASLADSAAKYYTNVLEIAEKLKSEKFKRKAYAGMGQLFIHVNEYLSAIHYLEMWEVIARKDGLKMSIMNANKHLADAHQQEAIRLINLGKYKKASEHFLVYAKKQGIYQQLKDSIFSHTKIRELSNVEQTYLLEQKDREAARVQGIENERKKNLRNIIYAAFSLLMFVLIFLYVMYKRFKVTKQLNQVIRSTQVELKASNAELERKAASVTSSITYASRIQKSILTTDDYLTNMFSEHFVLYKPRDIVSGDYYWGFQSKTGNNIWAVVDCTGHGVPGGFMSMIGNTLLNEIIVEKGIEHPNEILDKLRSGVIKTLDQTNKAVNNEDGMAIGLCVFDPSNQSLYYAGSEISLLLVRNNEIIEYLASWQPIGLSDVMEPFKSVSIQLMEGDWIYFSSDGFPDLIGGPKRKKYMSKRFKQFLRKISLDSGIVQKQKLEKEFNEWRGDRKQVDDVCVMGVKI